MDKAVVNKTVYQNYVDVLGKETVDQYLVVSDYIEDAEEIPNDIVEQLFGENA